LDLLAIDRYKIRAGGHFILQVPKNRVVLQKVRQRGRGGEVIDCDKFDLWVADRCAEDIASNAAEAVDANFHCHLCVLLSGCWELWRVQTHRTRPVGVLIAGNFRDLTVNSMLAPLFPAAQ